MNDCRRPDLLQLDDIGLHGLGPAFGFSGGGQNLLLGCTGVLQLPLELLHLALRGEDEGVFIL